MLNYSGKIYGTLTVLRKDRRMLFDAARLQRYQTGL